MNMKQSSKLKSQLLLTTQRKLARHGSYIEQSGRRSPLLMLALFALALMGSGCGMKLPWQQPVQQMPITMMSPCPPLPLLQKGDAPAVLRSHIEVTQMYRDCSLQVDGLSDWIRSERIE